MSHPTEDAAMGEWVYCCSHLRPHSTGWYTVPAMDKIRLGTRDNDTHKIGAAAHAECRAIGLHIYEEKTPWDWEAQRDLAEMLGGRHYRSWLVKDCQRRDALMSKLQGVRR